MAQFQLQEKSPPNGPINTPELAAVINLSRDAIAVISTDGSILFWNAGAARMFQYSNEEAIDHHYGHLLSRNLIDPFQKALSQTLSSGHWEGELVGYRKDGQRLVMLSRWQVEREQHQYPLRILISNTDIRLWDRFLSNTVRNRHQNFDALFSQHPDGVAAFDLAGRLDSFNPALLILTGYSQEELLSMPLASLLDAEDRDMLETAFFEACRGKPQSAEFACKRKDGGRIEVSITLLPNILSNRVVGVYAYVKDIGDRKQSERQLVYMANHDALTGLPNRNLLHDRMQHAIEKARRAGTQVAILFMDLNRFKIINDSLGHDKGDLLLCNIAERLRKALRDVDTVARLGGDEFVVVLENIHQDNEVQQVATTLLTAIARPLNLDGHILSVSTSIGASLYPRDGSDSFTLLKNADLAMYAAKESGPSQFQFYEPAMNDRAVSRLKKENRLRHAIESGELILHFQPRLDIESNTVACLEALVRWEHPAKGLIYPGHFIELAEETGMIDTLGEWVLKEACRQMKSWRDGGLLPMKISVNISALQLRSEGICDTVWNALKESGLEPDCLELEITESSLMQNLSTSLKTLTEFQRMGIALSIDDFGTGYSSLSYLKRLPINTLKIDKSFVRDLSQDADDAAIVSATIAMAHRMKLRVVAEGVISVEQMRFLEKCRCDEIQGYLLCQPLPAPEIEAYLRTCQLRGMHCVWTH